MNEFWNSVWQWFHSVGLHPDRDAVQKAGDAVLQGAGAVADTVSRVTSGMDMASLLALAAAIGWASGLRLYAVIFVVGMLGAMDWLVLPGSLGMLQHPIVLFISGAMLFVEFFADKIPVIDSVWDLMQSVLRVPAGAALAASVFGADNATMAMVAALMGGTLAATSQAAKTTTRALINTSPEPFSNVGASLAEDTVSVGAIWLALTNPLVFLAVLAVVVVLMWVVIWLLWRFLKGAVRRLRIWLGGESKDESLQKS